MGPKLVVSVRSLRIYQAFASTFANREDVEIHQCDIMSLPDVQVLLSPANSYGFMAGGVDQVYVYAFGAALEARVQEAIRTSRGGELPVGDALVVPTGDVKIPWLVVAPTMKIPGSIKGTDNVFLATRAALRAVKTIEGEPRIRRIGTPAFGTGTGQIPALEAAAQMLRALEEVSRA